MRGRRITYSELLVLKDLRSIIIMDAPLSAFVTGMVLPSTVKDSWPALLEFMIFPET